MRTPTTTATLTSLITLALVTGCSGADAPTTPTGTAGPSVTGTPAPDQPTGTGDTGAPEQSTDEEPTDDGPAEGPTGDDAPAEDPAGEDSSGEDPPDEPATGEPGQEAPTATDPGETAGGGGSPGEGPAPAPPAQGLAVPEGSGCAPGTHDLPDGQWYGMVSGAAEDSVQFDLACFFLGEEADRAALEDGEAMVPVPNGYYIRNDDPTLRTPGVAAGAQVLHYPTGDPATVRTVDFVRWAWLVQAGEVVLLGVWLTVHDGEVVAVEEQWTP